MRFELSLQAEGFSAQDAAELLLRPVLHQVAFVLRQVCEPLLTDSTHVSEDAHVVLPLMPHQVAMHGVTLVALIARVRLLDIFFVNRENVFLQSHFAFEQL